jgi:HEAT repeat protein
MRFCKHSFVWVASLSALLASFGLAKADRFPPDPVEELRLTLKATPEELARRDPAFEARWEKVKPEDRTKVFSQEKDKVLATRVAALTTIDDLRRALLLQEWRQEAESFDENNPERKSHTQITNRFRDEVREVLAHGSNLRRIATLNLLSETGFGVRTAEDRAGLTHGFAPDIAAMLKSGNDTQVRATAARALGAIFPDPNVAVPALEGLLTNGDVQERRAAAASLANIVRVATQLTASGSSATRVQATVRDVISAGKLVAPAAAKGLKDADVSVRQLAAEALELACSALAAQVPQKRAGDESLSYDVNPRDILDPERAELPQLLTSLAAQMPAVEQAAKDNDPTVRVRIRHAIEQYAAARQRLGRPAEGSQPPPAPRGAGLTPFHADTTLVSRSFKREAEFQQPANQRLQDVIEILAKGLSDPDVASRLAAVDALDAFGQDSIRAIPALTAALRDSDRFVRWASARTLGKIGAPSANSAVPALAVLLSDQDLDVCLAAATALDRIGPAAREAVPALTRRVRATDAEMRVAAMRSLSAIGTESRPAIPAMIQALSDPETRVRREAALVLGRFGSQAADAEPALRHAMSDPEPEVREAASEAILGLTKGR